MGVKLQSALGGSVELNAPSTASNFTMTVPAGNGTVATTDQLQNFRNLLINGEMRISQRGTSFAAGGNILTLDRWICWGMLTTQSTDVPSGSGFVNSIQLVATTQTGSSFNTIEQKFEDERIVAGRTLTMSFWIKGSAAGTGVVRNYSQSNTRGFGHIAFPITTAWTKISRTFTVPTIGAGTKDWCAFGMDFNVGSTAASDLGYGGTGVTAPTYVGTLNITGVQVEYGTVSTEFERRPQGIELALCQRYYEKSFAYAATPSNGGSATTFASVEGLSSGISSNRLNVGPTMFFKVNKRVIPSVQKYGNSAGDWVYGLQSSLSLVGNANCGTIRISESSFVADQQAVDATAIFIVGHWVANAEF